MTRYRRYHTLFVLALLSFLFLLPTDLLAQAKGVQLLGVTVKKKRPLITTDERLKDFSAGMQLHAIDTQLLQQYRLQNVAQLLAQQVPAFIKSYGVNSTATLSFRGASAAQSQVFWNGVPVNNATLGVADVSMLGVQQFDAIQVVYGGAAALLGSGNVGAALLLDNHWALPDTNKQLISNWSAEMGSFGQYKVALTEQWAKQHWMLDVKMMGQTAQNNFAYTDQQGQNAKMSNAALKSYAGMINFARLLDDHTKLRFSVWYQHYDRAIPPALFESISLKKQEDASLKLFLGVDKTISKTQLLYTKSAFMFDLMCYGDPAVALQTANHTQQWYQEFGWKLQLPKRQQILIFMPINIAWTKPNLDTQFRFQNKIALATAYKWTNKCDRMDISGSARIENINQQTVAMYGANIAYRIAGVLTLRANVQKTYRAPSLNEWYYQPGGNPLLKPEIGWSQDVGYALNWPLRKQVLFKQEVSVFSRVMKDWIMWLGGSIWTPHNIAQVYSRGLETFNTLSVQTGKWKFHLGLNSSFVLATTQKTYNVVDASIGKQIPYTPRYNGQANIGARIGCLYMHYNHTYTGYRFVTTDESQFLVPYQTGNLFLQYTLPMHHVDLKFSVQCNNLWDTPYQVMHLRPMPLRHYAIGIQALL
jgi:vitamin B12 transporter